MNRAARRRANRRQRRIEAGEVTDGDLRRILNGWRREADYRARAAFDGTAYGDERVVPAVWDLYRAKLAEARRLESMRQALRARSALAGRKAEKAGRLNAAHEARESCSEIPVDEELAEYCRRAIARYTEPATVHRTFLIGPGVAMVRG
ncbi:hypothetical protein KJ567_07155 [Candidatus Bipolaricaulota bacterium]|nr:hypothetical protein [Candidatus Bipolaricaulota bacterium]